MKYLKNVENSEYANKKIAEFNSNQAILEAMKKGCKFRTVVNIDNNFKDIYSEVFIKNNLLYTTSKKGEEIPLSKEMLSYIEMTTDEGKDSSIYKIQLEYIDKTTIKPLISDELNQVLVHLEDLAKKIWENSCHPSIKIRGIYDSILNSSGFNNEAIGLISVLCKSQTSEEFYLEYYHKDDRFELWKSTPTGDYNALGEIISIENLCNYHQITLDKKAKKWLKIN